MQENAIIDELRTLFNDAAGSVRFITFLSPTCGPYRYGQGVVRSLFEEFPDERLAAFVIWVPMLPTDNPSAAQVEQNTITAPRLHFWFDADKAAANTWSGFIGLPTATWDVYAVYDAAARWAIGGPPPAPNIWMHQLNPTAATRTEDRLDPARLARQWLELLGRDVGPADRLSQALHAKGEAVSVRDGGPPP